MDDDSRSPILHPPPPRCNQLHRVQRLSILRNQSGHRIGSRVQPPTPREKTENFDPGHLYWSTPPEEGVNKRRLTSPLLVETSTSKATQQVEATEVNVASVNAIETQLLLTVGVRIVD